MYIKADAHTRDELIEMEVWILAASRRPRLPISWSLLDECADAMQKQRNVVQFLIERTLIVYSMRDTCHHILHAWQ